MCPLFNGLETQMNNQPTLLTYQGRRAHFLRRHPHDPQLVEIIAAGHLKTVPAADVAITLEDAPTPEPTLTIGQALDAWLDGYMSGVVSAYENNGVPTIATRSIAAEILRSIRADPLAMDAIAGFLVRLANDDTGSPERLTVSLTEWAGGRK